MASYSGSRSQRLDLYNPADWIESSDAEDSSSESWEHSETSFFRPPPGGETAASWNAREVAGIDDDGGSSGEEDGASSSAVAVRGKEGTSSRTEILSWNSHQAELRERVSAVRLRYLRSASRQVGEMLGAVGDGDGQFSACVWFGAVAVHSHMPESDVEVQISRGDIVLVMSYEDDDWWYGRVLNRQGSTAEGWLPPSHLDAVDGILTALSVVQQLQQGVQQEQLSPPETAIEPSPSRRLRRSITELNSGLQQKLASQAMHDYGSELESKADGPLLAPALNQPLPTRDHQGEQQAIAWPASQPRTEAGGSTAEVTFPAQDAFPAMSRTTSPGVVSSHQIPRVGGQSGPEGFAGHSQLPAVGSSMRFDSHSAPAHHQHALPGRAATASPTPHSSPVSRHGPQGVNEGRPEQIVPWSAEKQSLAPAPWHQPARGDESDDDSASGYFLDYQGRAHTQRDRASLVSSDSVASRRASGAQGASAERGSLHAGPRAAPSPSQATFSWAAPLSAPPPGAHAHHASGPLPHTPGSGQHQQQEQYGAPLSVLHGSGPPVAAAGMSPSHHNVHNRFAAQSPHPGLVSARGPHGSALHRSADSQPPTPSESLVGHGYGGIAPPTPVQRRASLKDGTPLPLSTELFAAAPATSAPAGRIPISSPPTVSGRPHSIGQQPSHPGEQVPVQSGHSGSSYHQGPVVAGYGGAGPGAAGGGPVVAGYGGAGPGAAGGGPVVAGYGGAGPGAAGGGPVVAGYGGAGPGAAGGGPVVAGYGGAGPGGPGDRAGEPVVNPSAAHATHNASVQSGPVGAASGKLAMGGSHQGPPSKPVSMADASQTADDLSLFGLGLDLPAHRSASKARRHSDVSFADAQSRMQGSASGTARFGGTLAGRGSSGGQPAVGGSHQLPDGQGAAAEASGGHFDIYASLRSSTAAGGSSPAGGGTLVGGAPGAAQRDAAGRRVKVLTLSGPELWDIFRPLLFRRLVLGAGFMLRAARLATAARRSAKAFAAGLGPRCLKQFTAGRRTAKVWAMGMTAGGFGKRLGLCHRKLCSVFALGALVLDAKMKVAVDVGMLGPGGLAELPEYMQNPASVRQLFASASKKKRRTINTARKGKKGKGKAAAADDFDGVKTRNVHWDAISNVEGTMWDRGTSANLSLNPELQRRVSVVDAGKLVPSLEETFAANRTAKKPKKAGGVRPKGPKAITLLDSKAQQNIGIGVRGTLGKMSMATVAEALRKMDASALGGPDAVAALAELDAYSEEVLAPVRAFTGDASKLGIAEKYVREVSLAVSEPKARLMVMEFMFNMDEIKASADTKSGNLKTACHEIVSSKKFKTLLADVMLPLGNRLNAGSKKGMAAGIKLSSLNKLLNTRAATGETFLRFVVDGLIEMEGEGEDSGVTNTLLDLDEDMPTVLRVKHASMSPAIIELDVARLKKGCNIAESLLKKGQAAGDSGLVDILEPVVEDAQAALEEAAKGMYEAVEEFDKMCRFVGESKGKSTPEAVFGYVSRFVQQVTSEKKASMARAARKAKEAARKAQVQGMKDRKAGSGEKATPKKPKASSKLPHNPLLHGPKPAEQLPPKPSSKPTAPPKPGSKPAAPPKAGKPKPRSKRRSVLGGVGAMAPTQDEEKELVGQVQNKMMAKFRRASMALIAAGAIANEKAFFSGGEDDDDDEEGGGSKGSKGGAAGSGGRPSRSRTLSNIGEGEEEEEEEDDD